MLPGAAELVEIHDPDATSIQPVVDNPNSDTHTSAALSATFLPELAHRLARKLACHSTPKHGSWLNMVEIELGVLERQCLRRQLPSREAVQTEVAAWAAARNAAQVTIYWRFTMASARQKLGRHYATYSLWPTTQSQRPVVSRLLPFSIWPESREREMVPVPIRPVVCG